MKWMKHYELKDKHAFLSPSGYNWLSYDEDKLVRAYRNSKQKEIGTQLHSFASLCIRLNQRLPDEVKTLNMFVNDAIGFKMQSEQPLYYSDYCFGHADAICFRQNILRIYDYKSGATIAKMEQLYIYAALFCLEYKINPLKIKYDLRIYQSNQIVGDQPTGEFIKGIMDTIVRDCEILTAQSIIGESQ